MYFVVREGLTIDDVGLSRDTVFQEIRPGDGFETGDFVKEKLGVLPQNDSEEVVVTTITTPVIDTQQDGQWLRHPGVQGCFIQVSPVVILRHLKMVVNRQ